MPARRPGLGRRGANRASPRTRSAAKRASPAARLPAALAWHGVCSKPGHVPIPHEEAVMAATGQVPTPVETAAATAAAALQRRYPKIDPSPGSMRGLVEIFRRTKAGGDAFTPRTGQYIPV